MDERQGTLLGALPNAPFAPPPIAPISPKSSHPHALRYSLATHLLEIGYGIRRAATLAAYSRCSSDNIDRQHVVLSPESQPNYPSFRNEFRRLEDIGDQKTALSQVPGGAGAMID